MALHMHSMLTAALMRSSTDTLLLLVAVALLLSASKSEEKSESCVGIGDSYMVNTQAWHVITIKRIYMYWHTNHLHVLQFYWVKSIFLVS